jgi:hypothetical protein
MEPLQLQRLISHTEQTLLHDVTIRSIDHGDPVKVAAEPSGWKVLGAGNYAAVFVSDEYPEVAVKVYAEGREGWESECEVYRLIGRHPAYSECYHADRHNGHSYLLLKRLTGKTLYQCVLDGEFIPKQVIDDIDAALDYARAQGLHPHDVHGKDGRGLVVDISDFLKTDPCTMWDDLKKAYNRIYMPFLSKKPIPVPEWVMNGVRKGYRWMRHSSIMGRSSSS